MTQSDNVYAELVTTKYFRLWYRLGARDAYLVWWSSDQDGDGVLVDTAGKVPSFSSIAGLCAYAHGRGLDLVDEKPILHDLDSTAKWVASTEDGPPDCDNLLAAWNLFSDVFSSTAGDFDADQSITHGVYDKLFYGGETANNVLKPKEEPRYAPKWSHEEIGLLRETLGQGLAMFERVLVPVA